MAEGLTGLPFLCMRLLLRGKQGDVVVMRGLLGCQACLVRLVHPVCVNRLVLAQVWV